MTAKPAGIDMERNYVSVTLCISKRFLPLFGVVGNAKFAQLCHFHRVECGNTVTQVYLPVFSGTVRIVGLCSAGSMQVCIYRASVCLFQHGAQRQTLQLLWPGR